MELFEIKRKIKSSIIIRAIAAPYMIIKKRIILKEYSDSPDSNKIRQLKDICYGQRCFLIGNGPSLSMKDLDKLKNEITFAGNRIFDVFPYTQWRPDYYFLVDKDAFFYLDDVINSDLSNIYLCYEAKKQVHNETQRITYINSSGSRYVINRYNDKKIFVSEKLEKEFSVGYTVLFTAFQMAVYMGIKEIYLLGVDFDYHYTSNKYGRIMTNSVGEKSHHKLIKESYSYLNYYSVLRAWNVAKSFCKKNGIKIY